MKLYMPFFGAGVVSLLIAVGAAIAIGMTTLAGYLLLALVAVVALFGIMSIMLLVASFDRNPPASVGRTVTNGIVDSILHAIFW